MDKDYILSRCYVELYKDWDYLLGVFLGLGYILLEVLRINIYVII